MLIVFFSLIYLLLCDCRLKTAVKLGILYLLVSPYQPLPDDIFSFRWRRPFDIRLGWFLWACGGLIVAASAVFLVEAVISSPTVGRESEEAETLMHLLPLIGSSNISTFCLFGILGILAPFCEETLYRGFLMTSLTKWLPLPISVTVSSAVFALAHQSPGKFLQIFIFGNVLGLVYARTRNLLSPILMHAWWNTGVILALTILQTQGYDIQKYIL
ncbi:hypothetical protein QJS04_geneDACA003472 [Acorus gramineus]|uniref:CAAX prenyl protease 2/Lysostaphin resistance protein A-like domain-containing protein n=1 Tax=Acorus gramineus TaxID=55184 RepID=A0AAV9BRF7_ACOGR|nr:hypothetical protein QJS04_geneDACA003472 [Acorus gramineus]